jgi:phage antirepressor YoqD-like protein
LDARIQRDKLKQHEVFSKGCTLIPTPSNGGIQETWMIELEYLPLWLATITPNRVKDGVKEKLIEYQLKAKDVLANEFITQYMMPKTYIEALKAHLYEVELRVAAEEKVEKLEEEIIEMQPKVEFYDTVAISDGNFTVQNVAKMLGTGEIRLFRFLRERKILDKDNIAYQRYIDSDYFKVILKTRNDVIYGEVPYKQTLVRPKGIQFIEKLLKEDDKD